MGPRWIGSDKVKLVCRQYNTFHENYIKVNETLRELYWEAKRAPTTFSNAITNPYRRDKLKKKLFGRTKAERIAKVKAIKELEKEQIKKVDLEEMGILEKKKKDTEALA